MTGIAPEPLTLVSADGTALSARVFKGADARSVVIVSHGLGEHSLCYDEISSTLAATPGMAHVVAFDYRGHGTSPGKRGVIRAYDDFVDDLRAALSYAQSRWPDLPRFILGHSNGGQVALHVALRPDSGIAGLILSNPSLKISASVPLHKYLAGLALRRFAPGVTLESTVLDEHLTRDPAHLSARKGDPLRHGRISAPLFFGMVEGGLSVLARASEIRYPLLLIIGGSDPVVDAPTTLAFFDRVASPDKTLKLYPDMLHEPLNDLGREQVVAEILAWLASHIETWRPLPGGKHGSVREM